MKKSRIALTLRTLGGLTTDEVSRAFLDQTTTMAQRLSRARAKISKAGIPFEIPDGEDLPERIASVLQVIYLIFNEGYAATKGAQQIRVDLCKEAIFLSRLMAKFCPDNAEVSGLLALILLTHARRKARQMDAVYIPLPDQDRSLWNGRLIREGQAILEAALRKGQVGPYQLQAAISALHCEAASYSATDWAQIAALYRLMLQMEPNAVVQLNLAVAVSYSEGVDSALEMLEKLQDTLSKYQPFHAAYADILKRAGQKNSAKAAFKQALALSHIESERHWLQGQLDRL